MIQFRRREPGGGPAGACRFQPGSIVFHRRYRYRGLVVEVDTRCLADESWYLSNSTQPDRDQPWYHTLVDGAQHTTYVAQENLLPDPSGAAVEHPLLELYFSGFAEGFYIRNETPWGH